MQGKMLTKLQVNCMGCLTFLNWCA